MGVILVVGGAGIFGYNKFIIGELSAYPDVAGLISSNNIYYFGGEGSKSVNYTDATRLVNVAAKGKISAAIVLDHMHVESSVKEFALAVRKSGVSDIPIISISGDSVAQHARVLEHDGALIPGIYVAEKRTDYFPSELKDMELILRQQLSGSGDLYFVVEDRIRTDSTRLKHGSPSTLDDVVVGERKLNDVSQGETFQVQVPGSTVKFQKQENRLVATLSGLDELSATSYVRVHSFGDFECHLSEFK